MALTIVATAGAAGANSFVTEAEQIAYMEARLNSSAWTTKSGATLTETEKTALIEATRELNRMRWAGERTDDVQALAWPRQNAVNPDDPTYSYFGTDELPQRVKNATFELAFQFVKAGTTDVAALPDTDGIKRKKIDVLETEYFGPEAAPATGLERYPRVWGEIAPLLAAGSAGLYSPLLRG